MLIELLVTGIFICLSTCLLVAAYVCDGVAVWLFLAVVLIVLFELWDAYFPRSKKRASF